MCNKVSLKLYLILPLFEYTSENSKHILSDLLNFYTCFN